MRTAFLLKIVFFLLLFVCKYTDIRAQSEDQADSVTFGKASYYHDKFVGRKTANGELFSQEKLTAAHKTLPMGTYVKVTNLKNRKSVVVKVNDRLPQNSKRTIDLTKAAAKELNMIRSGLAQVSLEIIQK